jgi:hypothetical protein
MFGELPSETLRRSGRAARIMPARRCAATA